MTDAGLFCVTTQVISGLGSIGQLDDAVLRLGGSRVIVVADAGVGEAGLIDKIVARVSFDPVGVILVEADPDISVVEDAAAIALAASADLVVAIGGGSALGVGKAVGIRLTNPLPIDSYEGVGLVANTPAPVIALPTTAGSGSEVSNALVLHEPGRSKEIVIRGAGCEPRVAILDGEILRTLPYRPMLYAGFDALSHAMEALWANGGTYFTEALALHSARTILDLLPLAIEGIESGRNATGENDEILQRLLEASSAANMACGNSGLALVHALTTSPDIRIPHGLQNAVLLPYVAAFNNGELSVEARALVPLIDALFAQLGFEPSFPAIGEDDVDGSRMIEASKGHPFRINNRRESSDDDLVDLLANAGAQKWSAR